MVLMPIEYRLIRRRDVQEAHADSDICTANITYEAVLRTGIQSSDSARKPISCHQNVDPDDVCGVIALDGDRQVARIALAYTYLSVGGELQKAAVGSDFYVDPEYRNQAVGLNILLKILGLGMPYIEAAVSGQMKQILERFPKFIRVDNSPVFQVPVTNSGIMQMARWRLYASEGQITGFLSDKFIKAKILGALWMQRLRIIAGGGGTVQVIGPEEALQYCRTQFRDPLFPVQLPWTVDGLRRALIGKSLNHKAWLVKVKGEEPRLLSMYRKERLLGYDKEGRPRTLIEAHLNEVYPPPQVTSKALPLLSFALTKARDWPVQVLHLHGNSASIEEACRQAVLHSHTTKSIFIAPGNVSEPRRSILSKPENWFCRADSEDEFEESFCARNSEAIVA